MELLGKTLRGLSSIPVIGGFVALLIGILPVILLLPVYFKVDGTPNEFLVHVVAGVLIAAWCFWLSKKKIMNIVTPFLPLPFWILGILIALGGLYQYFFGPL